MSRKDLWAAPLGEGLLVLTVALVGFATHQPFVFASLGPTAYEQVEKPESPSAHPYNVIVGHILAVAAGYAAIAILQAWNGPAHRVRWRADPPPESEAAPLLSVLGKPSSPH